MSIEYEIRLSEKHDECFLAVSRKVKGHFSDVRKGIDCSLYRPSATPNWVDFSVEKTETGLFVVSNQSGPERIALLELIESVLAEIPIVYCLEEV